LTQSTTQFRMPSDALDRLDRAERSRDGSEDCRLQPARWRTDEDWRRAQMKLRLLLPCALILTVWYFAWLLRPVHVGNPALYGLLVFCELFNVLQAIGFWWTCIHGRIRPSIAPSVSTDTEVDVLVPVYTEPLDVVIPTIQAAVAMRGARVNVYVLDDAGRPELAALAARCGAHYICRSEHRGAKAGNLNHALQRTHSPFVAVFDCDHVPDERFLEATLGYFKDDEVGYVQTPQYYANAGANHLAAAAWSQQ
jgi:cellulose synthase (UDP-forming)